MRNFTSFMSLACVFLIKGGMFMRSVAAADQIPLQNVLQRRAGGLNPIDFSRSMAQVWI